MEEVLNRLKSYLPSEIYRSLQLLPEEYAKAVTEIRLRLERPSSITVGNKNLPLIHYNTGQSLCMNREEMEFCFKKICENSIYKYVSEIKNGYITLPGGSRVGFCGTRVENGMIKDISAICFRISKSILNAAHEIYPAILKNGKIQSSLIVGEPGCGKTTVLSDLAHKLSEEGYRVAVVDERSEIAAVHNGIPQKATGRFCDVLDGYPKGEGMMIALRSLSPQALVCDEIGSAQDVQAMLQAMNAGVPVIASAHAEDLTTLMQRPQLRTLIDSGAIEQLFLLEGAAKPGKLKQIKRAFELYEDFLNTTDADRGGMVRTHVHAGTKNKDSDS